MSIEDNKALVRRYVEEVLNQKNLAVVDELLATTFVDHDSSMPEAKGPEGIKRLAAMVHASFPDLHFTIGEMIAEGDRGWFTATRCVPHIGKTSWGFPRRASKSASAASTSIESATASFRRSGKTGTR